MPNSLTQRQSQYPVGLLDTFHYKDKGFENFVLHHSSFIIIIIIIAYKRQQESKQIKNSRGGRYGCSLKIDSFFFFFTRFLQSLGKMANCSLLFSHIFSSFNEKPKMSD